MCVPWARLKLRFSRPAERESTLAAERGRNPGYHRASLGDYLPSSILVTLLWV